ncbi:MAG: arginine N-succinyltransferase [Rhodocyclaceae bacterium]|nr:arginine N-succinyltransferase [Rhodocyclaceae bacterium]MBP7080401.1 arginine N-succinyltransferase [Rhodocyclaceae bacterium]
MKTSHFVLRPAGINDLDAIERFAAASGYGINSLPPRRERLVDRIERSQRAFAAVDSPSSEDIYLFVLEDLLAGRVIGTSGITASAGAQGRFYSYRNEFALHVSEELGITNRIHTLRLCQDLSGHTLLTSFYIEPDYAATMAPQILSRARLLFISQYPALFSDRLAAESPGLCDENGRSPLWEALGRRFFNMDYAQAELLSEGRSKSFIGELMPSSPIYVPLLADEAQWALGQLHPAGELPFSILLDEGFDPDTYVDIFDGGPTVEARAAMVNTVFSGKAVTLVANAQCEPDDWYLIGNGQRSDFRATLVQGTLQSDKLTIDKEDASRISADTGTTLHVSRAGWAS